MNGSALPFGLLFLFCFTYTVIDLIWRLNHRFVMGDARRREKEARGRWQASEAITLQAHRTVNAAACGCAAVGAWTCRPCERGDHRSCRDGARFGHCLCAHFGHER